MIDLHVHSTASDGQYSPKEIVELAVKNHVTAIALTDHDTMDGLEEAEQTAKLLSIQFVPGIEISVQGFMGVKELHILGYGIDPKQKSLQEFCKKSRDLRQERATKIYDYLKENGMPIRPGLAEQFAGNGAIGRPHFAQAMVEMGYVSNTRQAFHCYLDTPDFKQIPRPLPTAGEAIQVILETGGIPVLAHPIQMHLSPENLERLVWKLKLIGLKGLECYYSTHTCEDTAFYLQLARKCDFLITGGSDFHGERIKPTIKLGSGIKNSLYVPDELIFPIIKEQKYGI